MTKVKQRKERRMRSAHSPTVPSQLILQPFLRFTYVTAHSPTLLSLLLRRAVHDFHIAKHKHLLAPSIVAHICHNFQRLSHNIICIFNTNNYG